MRHIAALVLLTSIISTPEISARGFKDNTPAKYPSQAKADFILGEWAVNSFINRALKNPIVRPLQYGGGGPYVIIETKRALVDFEEGQAFISLIFTITYPVPGGTESRTVALSQYLSAGQFKYNLESEKVWVDLSGLVASAGLPNLPKTFLEDLLRQFSVYAGKLFSDVGGFTLPPVGGQLTGDYPVFYMGTVSLETFFEDDFVRLSVGPSLEFEKPRIEIYRSNQTTTSSRLTFITNFSGTVSDVSIQIGGAGGGTYSSTVLSGPFTLSIDQSSNNPRGTRYNYTTQSVSGYGYGMFSAIVTGTTGTYRVAMTFGFGPRFSSSSGGYYIPNMTNL